MAITYRRIDDLLNTRKQDILPGGSNAPQTPQANPEAPGFAVGTGSTGSGFAGNVTPVKDTAPARIGTSANVAGALVNLNKGQITENANAAVSTDIKNAQDKLKSYADNYITGAKQFSEKFNVNDDTLQKLYAGDQKAYDDVQARLMTVWDDSKMEKYAPNMDEIRSLQMLVKPDERKVFNAEQRNKQTGGKYTAGMSNFDDALLRAADVNYNKVFEANDALAKQAKQYQDAADAQRGIEAGEYGSEVGSVKGRIDKYIGDLFRTSNSDTFNKNQQAYLDQLAKIRGGLTQAQADSIEGRIAKLAPEQNVRENMKKDIDKLLSDIASGKYVSTESQFKNNEKTSMIDQGTADKLNKLRALTGTGSDYSGGTYTNEAKATGNDADIDRLIKEIYDSAKSKNSAEWVDPDNSVTIDGKGNVIDVDPSQLGKQIIDATPIIPGVPKLPGGLPATIGEAINMPSAYTDTTKAVSPENSGIPNDSGAPEFDPKKTASNTFQDKINEAGNTPILSSPIPGVPLPLPGGVSGPTFNDIIDAMTKGGAANTTPIVTTTQGAASAIGNNAGATGGVGGQPTVGAETEKTIGDAIGAGAARLDPYNVINSMLGGPAQSDAVTSQNPAGMAVVEKTGEAQTPGQQFVAAPATNNLIKDGYVDKMNDYYAGLIMQAAGGNKGILPAGKKEIDAVWDAMMTGTGQVPSKLKSALRQANPKAYEWLITGTNGIVPGLQAQALLAKMSDDAKWGDKSYTYRPLFTAGQLATNWWK